LKRSTLSYRTLTRRSLKRKMILESCLKSKWTSLTRLEHFRELQMMWREYNRP
jgi:hypothetical protein